MAFWEKYKARVRWRSLLVHLLGEGSRCCSGRRPNFQFCSEKLRKLDHICINLSLSRYHLNHRVLFHVFENLPHSFVPKIMTPPVVHISGWSYFCTSCLFPFVFWFHVLQTDYIFIQVCLTIPAWVNCMATYVLDETGLRAYVAGIAAVCVFPSGCLERRST